MNAPAPDLAKHIAGLSRLAQLEWEVRQADRVADVAFIAVNDTHRVVAYDHALLWLARTGRIGAVSGGVTIDQQAPAMVWFAAAARALIEQSLPGTVMQVTAAMLPPVLRPEATRYLLGHGVLVPLTGPGGRCEGALIVLRIAPFNESEERVLARLGSAYGQALVAIAAPRLRLPDRTRRWALAGLGVIAVACLLSPVRMSVLADARVAPVEPEIVAAPIDGAIKDILVEPNADVQTGDLLVRFDTTDLDAQHAVAQKRLAVLEADLAVLEQRAFADAEARAEVSLARMRVEEGRAELDYARDRLQRAEIRARSAGVAMIDNPTEWIGRPVQVGEGIMAIADPTNTRLELQIAVEDVPIAAPGAEVEFFLATAPQSPVPARLGHISYDARLLPNQSVAFIARAEFVDAKQPPRLGLTGTAKIHGDRQPLYYLLLRKPLAALRRLTGY